MHRALSLVHRWLGGVLGLVLTVLGLSGTLLLHKAWWVSVPGRPVPADTDLALVVGRTMAGPDAPRSILFASDEIPFHRLSFDDGAGGYVDATGRMVARWTGVWDRPELWLFDLHHHLLAGETGEIVAGVAALAGLVFVLTGLWLWWPTRRTFRLRALPKRMSRPAVVRHHRDLGAVVAPLLLLSFVTGAMMIFDPVRITLLSLWSSAQEMEAAAEPPGTGQAELASSLPWAAMLATAQTRFPDAEPRVLSLPRKAGDPVTLRVRRTHEWLPNGRTTLWFRPDTGALIEARDEARLPAGSRLFNKVYPLHAAKVGGLTYRLTMTLAGLALVLLGSLTVWTFWFRRSARR